MIRINLLPHQRKAAAAAAGTAVQQLAVMVLVLLLPLAYFYYQKGQLEQTQADLTRQFAELEKEIEEKKALIRGLEPLEALRKETEQKLDVVNQVQKQKVNPVGMLDTLQSLMRPRVWIRQFDDRAGVVSVIGIGANPQDVAELMGSLEANPHFQAVRLLDMADVLNIPGDVLKQLQSQPNLHIVKFNMQFKYVKEGGAG